MLQKVLDSFYYFRKWVLDWIAYLSIRFYGIDNRTFEEVKRQTSNKSTHVALTIDNTADLDLLLALAKDSYKAAHERRALVFDKCKTLQALSAFLLTIMGVFLPKAFDFESMWMRIVFYLAALFLLNAVTLLLVYLAVGPEAVIAVDQEKTRMEGCVLRRRLLNEYGQCTVAADNRTDYLVDIYKVSRFFFLFAFTLVVVLFSISYLTRASGTDADKIVQQLRSDPTLIDLLRGPRGEPGVKGDKGDCGDKGERGPNGETGRKGDSGTVDVDDVVKRLAGDPKFKRLLQPTATKEP